MNKMFFGVMAAMLAMGCSNSGSAYLGQWVNVKNVCRTVAIEKNGDNYLVTIEQPGFFGMGGKSRFPANLKDGALSFNNGLTAVPMVIEQKTGNLLIDNGEFRRRNDGDKGCSAQEK